MREPAKAGDGRSPLIHCRRNAFRDDGYSFVDAVARFTGSLHISLHPGVPLRSTPGFMLSPALRVRIGRASTTSKYSRQDFAQREFRPLKCKAFAAFIQRWATYLIGFHYFRKEFLSSISIVRIADKGTRCL
jgi:hypothetical protein